MVTTNSKLHCHSPFPAQKFTMLIHKKDHIGPHPYLSMIIGGYDAPFIPVHVSRHVFHSDELFHKYGPQAGFLRAIVFTYDKYIPLIDQLPGNFIGLNHNFDFIPAHNGLKALTPFIQRDKLCYHFVGCNFISF